MMHGPDRLGKPHILPLCLKEGSMERSHKKKKRFTIALSYRMRHLQRDGPPKEGTGSVWVLLSKAHIILRTSDHSQCKPKASVAGERDCTLVFFLWIMQTELEYSTYSFPLCKGRKNHQHLALYDKYSFITDERILSKEWERDSW